MSSSRFAVIFREVVKLFSVVMRQFIGLLIISVIQSDVLFFVGF